MGTSLCLQWGAVGGQGMLPSVALAEPVLLIPGGIPSCRTKMHGKHCKDCGYSEVSPCPAAQYFFEVVSSER